MQLDRNRKVGNILEKLALWAVTKSQTTGENGVFRSTMTVVNHWNHLQTLVQTQNSFETALLAWQTAEMYISHKLRKLF